MRLCALGSGSRGNATLIEYGDTTVLVDCGFPARELEKRAEQAGLSLHKLSAILVTHEHGDHIRGVGAVARRYDVPVWATHGTLRKGKCGKLAQVNVISPHHDSFHINDIEVQPVPVPHDACEPCQYIFTSASGKKLGMLTDLGCITPQIVNSYRQLDLLLLECNHDTGMLANGPYPPSLQARVGGNHGHLNNHQAAQLLQAIEHGRLQHLVLAHLSEKNNQPARVSDTICDACPDISGRFSILQQDAVSDWFEISD
ncbi:MAG: MBL fold metallo-hydrolase [Chromatiales bacterium]|jgi:phosphoribosyl 1,2-cyclic phosphodiesterase